MSDAALAPYRVLDLTDERGLLCGQILADLGADVIQVEPPGGSRARRLGPFAGARPDPESSLWWWAYARNKRSVVLDLEREEGREALRELARTADFLIESEDPGRLAALGLGPDDLLSRNPRLVYVSITPFGQDGPKHDWAASDMTVLAAAGPLVLTGDEDRPPLRLGAVPQAFLHASADAAVAALAAHHERARSGRGQHVDVSAAVSAMIATQFYSLSALMRSPDGKRISGGIKLGPLRVPLVWAAKDGYVSFAFLFGTALGPFTRRFMEYLCEQGGCDEAMRDKDWIGYVPLLFSGAEPIEEWDRVERTVAAFISNRTKAELLALTIERGFLFAPVATISEVVESPQLAAREYFRRAEHADGRSVLYPGAFAKLGRSPIRQVRPPPRIGEHQAEVLGEARERRPAGDPAPSGGEGPPLDGVKILDFTWVMAGPAATRMLADLGATVVRIESPTRADVARTVHPFFDNKPHPDGAALFGNCNAGKLGITLDLSRPEGRDVVLDLVRWADVVTESFSPKAMRNWGLGYERLREVNPRIIMLSSSLMGQTGPHSSVAGFGTMGAAFGGFHHLTSWPDRPPAGVFAAYTDYVSPRFTAAAILAALEHRRRTGEGQYVDQSQIEASLHFLAPAILDWTVNGRNAEPMGNDDAHFAPHGVYPCAGDDAWIAIACRSDEEWRGLCSGLGRGDLAADSRFATAAGRLEHRRELDEAVSAWTRGLPPREAEERLQQAGVAAHGVQNGRECATDPQLLHRDHFVEVPHGALGKVVVEGPRARLSRTPARVTKGAPSLGEHNHDVLATILGYEEERITALAAAGVLG